MAYTTAQIMQIITQVANSKGVDPNLAIADAEVESNLNPYAVGDYGTSFGLYQLHEGGELGNLTPQQAFNPTTNASVALSNFANVQAQNPNMDPGWIAAEAQNPSNKPAYAQAVDAKLVALQNGQSPTSQTYTSSGSSTSMSGPTSFLSGGGSLGSFLNPQRPSTSLLNPTSYLDLGIEKLFYMGLGLGLIVVGLFITFRNSQPVKDATKLGEKAGETAAL